MSKKIKLTTRPAEAPSMDDWVVPNLGKTEKPKGKMKRLTIDIEPELHTELKIHCVKNGLQIAEFVRRVILEKLEENRSILP